MSIKLGLHIKLTLIAWGVLSFISINGSWEIKKTISIIFLHLVQQDSVIGRSRLHAELALKNSSITFSKTWKKSRIRTACVIVRDGINYHPIKGAAVFNKRCRCLFQKVRVISINTKESKRMNVLYLEKPRWEKKKHLMAFHQRESSFKQKHPLMVMYLYPPPWFDQISVFLIS